MKQEEEEGIKKPKEKQTKKKTGWMRRGKARGEKLKNRKKQIEKIGGGFENLTEIEITVPEKIRIILSLSGEIHYIILEIRKYDKWYKW